MKLALFYRVYVCRIRRPRSAARTLGAYVFPTDGRSKRNETAAVDIESKTGTSLREQYATRNLTNVGETSPTTCAIAIVRAYRLECCGHVLLSK